MATVSLREYGRQRGVSGEAVRKAIKAGRLVLSVSRDAKGWPLIDPVTDILYHPPARGVIEEAA